MLKQTDWRILQHLRADARTNLTTISRRTGIPVSTIFDRIKAYEHRFVRRFTALLDFAALGYAVHTSILLKVDPQSREKVKAYLLAHQQVNSLSRINNGYDYAAECVFTSIREAEEFVEGLEMQFLIRDRQVFHIIEELAREKVMTMQAFRTT